MSVADDRAAITDVLARYAVALDDRDFDAVGECFTEDARATFSGVALQPGRATIVDHVSRLADFAASTHLLGVPVIEVDGDVARTTTPALAFLRDATAVRTRGLRYTDVLRRHEGRWLIAERVHRVDWMYETPASP